MLSAEWKPGILIPGRLVRCCQMGQRSRQPGTAGNFIGCDRGARKFSPRPPEMRLPLILAAPESHELPIRAPGHLRGHRTSYTGPLHRRGICGSRSNLWRWTVARWLFRRGHTSVTAEVPTDVSRAVGLTASHSRNPAASVRPGAT